MDAIMPPTAVDPLAREPWCGGGVPPPYGPPLRKCCDSSAATRDAIASFAEACTSSTAATRCCVLGSTDDLCLVERWGRLRLMVRIEASFARYLSATLQMLRYSWMLLGSSTTSLLLPSTTIVELSVYLNHQQAVFRGVQI